jgi:hypothetical protein
MSHRRLTREEIDHARKIFGDALDYGVIRITQGSVFALFSATAVGNSVNLQPRHFAGAGLAAPDPSVLIHELAHVWQFQHEGPRYIISSLVAQLRSWLATGSRRGAYDWRSALDNNLPWPRWNAEQQAQCFSDFHDALQRIGSGSAAQGDHDLAALAEPILRLALSLNRRGSCE